MKPATVYLIGAGPGDPGLLTLRGAELLGQVDVVLFDGLSNPQLLRHAPTAQHICVGKHGQSRIWRQEEIIQEMLRHARAGRAVARLKGGDPAVFARTAEEAAALRQAGVPFEIVPGITAALAAGSYAGIPVTHRGLASAVALVTGHEEPGKEHSALDWDALARFPGTLVVYMGVTTVQSWSAALLAGGKPPDTPVAILRRCSLPDQQCIHCRLEEVADQLAGGMRPPVIVIIGPVTELSESLSWFDRRPLFGRRILVTRPRQQADDLGDALRALGAEVLVQPAIEIAAADDCQAVDQQIDRLSQYDLIAFSSRNGVRYFLDRLLQRGGDLRMLGSVQIAAVGTATADALQQYHLRADWIPPDFRAESLAQQLAPHTAGKRVLLVRASRGRDVLAQTLAGQSAEVTEVVAYQHTDVATADDEILQLMQQQAIDWVTVTSSAIARSLHRMFGPALQKTRLASLSPITTATLAELGLRPSVEASQYTMQGLVDAIAAADVID